MATSSRTPPRLSGTVVDWFDERGYGFLEDAAGQRYFFHVTSLQAHHARASVGDSVTFTPGPGKDGKTAAYDVGVAGATPRRAPLAEATESFRVYAASLLVGLLILTLIRGLAPAWLPGAYLFAGLVSAFLYSADKRRAAAGDSRIPEVILHAIDFAFGIIGGLFAQHFMHHKTSKPGFAATTGLIAGIHLLFMIVLLAGLLPLAGIAILAH